MAATLWRHMVINTDNDPGLFEGVFQFSVQETSKDLSQNGKHIVLTPEQEVDWKRFLAEGWQALGYNGCEKIYSRSIYNSR